MGGNSGKRGKKAVVGPKIFAEVEKLVAEEKLTRIAAFKRIAEKSGRREGTVSSNYYSVARKRGATLQRRRRSPGRPTKATRSTSHGSIGREIFDQVEKMVAAEKISHSGAFRKLEKETGRRAGTIAANYYRIARKGGATLRPRRSTGGRRGRPTGSSGRASRLLNDLMSVIQEQERELERLRAENRKLAEVQRLLRH